MQSALVLMPVLVFIPLCAFLVPVLVRLLRPCRSSELTLDWYESFQVTSYRPMQGLLAAEDFQFLSRQPGFDPSLFRKLRRDRLRIFRGYLSRLIVDFNRLHTLARLVISQMPEDHSEMFGQLLALRIRFWAAILRVECSYLLCRFDMRPVGVANVIDQLEEMSLRLVALAPPKNILAS